MRPVTALQIKTTCEGGSLLFAPFQVTAALIKTAEKSCHALDEHSDVCQSSREAMGANIVSMLLFRIILDISSLLVVAILGSLLFGIF